MHKILFQIGSVTLYTYGFFVALGFLVSLILITRDARKTDLPVDGIFDCVAAILFGGLIGGRLLFVLLNWEYFSNNIFKIVMINEGGMAVQGGIVVALLFGWGTCIIKKIPFLKAADLIAPYIALGQSIGRIGCLMNGCCYGKIVQGGFYITINGETVSRSPVQIYSSLALAGIFIVLLFLREKKRFPGFVFSMYIILYAVIRFMLDFLRGDPLEMVFGITLSQAISIVMFISGIVLIFILGKRKTDSS